MSRVWIDGELCAPAQARVSALDAGLLFGLGIYETLRVERAHVYRLDAHIERLAQAARWLDFPWPPPWDPRAAILATAAELGDARALLRATYTRGPAGGRPSLSVAARAFPARPAAGARLGISRWRKLAGDPLESLKITSRARLQLAREEAEQAGWYDALLATHEGDLAEGSFSNLWIARGDELCTPALERGCLPGLTRQTLLEALAEPAAELGARPRVRVARIERAELAQADEVLLSNTSAGVLGVLAIEGFDARWPGDSGRWAQRLQRLLAACDARDRGARE